MDQQDKVDNSGSNQQSGQNGRQFLFTIFQVTTISQGYIRRKRKIRYCFLYFAGYVHTILTALKVCHDSNRINAVATYNLTVLPCRNHIGHLP